VHAAALALNQSVVESFLHGAETLVNVLEPANKAQLKAVLADNKELHAEVNELKASVVTDLHLFPIQPTHIHLHTYTSAHNISHIAT